jgi:hypothetical protein
MAPNVEGFVPFWWNDFQGDGGSFLDQNQWEIIEKGANEGNHEVQAFIKTRRM